MNEDFVDDDGYPTDEALDRITNWNHGDGWVELMQFIQSIWRASDWGFRVEENEGKLTYNLYTGGWSGNESIIGSMQKNYFFWATAWVQSRRGGHYIFEI
jgi:hypothetical protein